MREVVVAALVVSWVACGSARPRVEVTPAMVSEVERLSAATCDCLTVSCLLDVHVEYRTLLDQLEDEPRVQDHPDIRDDLAMHALCVMRVRQDSMRQRALARERADQGCLRDPQCNRRAFIRKRVRSAATFVSDVRALVTALCECKDAACAGEVGEHLRSTVDLHEDDGAVPASLEALEGDIARYRRCVAPLCGTADTTCRDDSERLFSAERGTRESPPPPPVDPPGPSTTPPP